MTRGPVLIVVHEGRRSGPPIYALHLVGWLARNADVELEVLVLEDGPLVEEFAAVVPTTVAEEATDTRQRLERADLVYVNTAISARVLLDTRARPRRVLTHVHELDIGLRHYLLPDVHDHLFSVTDHYLVGPDIARQNLVDHHDVALADITRVPYFVTPHGALPERSSANRAELGLPEDAVVVGACGTRDWRKAPDLFTHLSWEIDRRVLSTETHFVWLGSAIPTEPHWNERLERELLERDGRMDFVEHQALPQRWMAEFDVFTLTSREDCFPLVCLEAAEMTTPTVCFDNGGIPELVEASGGGLVVPYPDVAAMADAVEALVEDPVRRRAMGARARDHVAAHHQLDQSGPLVAEAIDRVRA